MTEKEKKKEKDCLGGILLIGYVRHPPLTVPKPLKSYLARSSSCILLDNLLICQKQTSPYKMMITARVAKVTMIIFYFVEETAFCQ